MLILQVYCAFLLHGLCYHIVTGGQSTWGQQFVIPFLSNFEKKGTIYIKMVTKVETSVYVEIPWESKTDSFTILAYSQHTVELQWDNRYEENLAVVKKAMFINATAKITVYSHSYVFNSGSGFLAIPVNVLGDYYIAVSYTRKSFNTSVVVAAVEDATEVIIHYNTHGGVCGPDGYQTGDISIHMLHRLDVIGVHCTEDLTGTSITSNRPISVVSGNVGGNVPVNVNGKDVMEDMLIPVKDFGFEYVLTNAGRAAGSINRIVAVMDNTTVNSSSGAVYHINALDFIDIDTDTHGEQCIQTSDPVMVVAFGKGIQVNTDKKGDPFMTVIPSTNSFSNEYFFGSDLGQGIGAYSGSDFITVIASVDGIGDLEAMLTATHTPLSNSNYGVIHTQITTWPLQLQTDNNTIFGATLYSVSLKFRGVAFPLGMVLEPQICWSSTCLNNGICHEVNDSFVCECQSGFTGDVCQYDPDTSLLTSVSPVTNVLDADSTNTFITPNSGLGLTEVPSTQTMDSATVSPPLVTPSTTTYATTPLSETEYHTLTTSLTMSQFQPHISTSPVQPGIPSELNMIPTTLNVDVTLAETILTSNSAMTQIPIQKEISFELPGISTTLKVDATPTEAILANLFRKANSIKDISSSACLCLCKGARLEVLDEAVVKEVTDEIKEELLLDTKSLSKTVRKYISATDERSSAKDVGTLGIVLLSFTFGLMIVPDILSCCKRLYRALKR
ncbi:IgGFc-binding protein-like [Haliotis cracherodii]|uniref:IgGFc-binding protein-like n=1 Tax=Haliotis cracherodii TaxID=6455 RepID=UPI0039EC496D